MNVLCVHACVRVCVYVCVSVCVCVCVCVYLISVCICVAMLVCMAFTGSTAPYHITQPSTDHYEQRIFPTATTANITCALNISISTNIVVTWKHNNSIITTARPPNEIIKAGNAITFLIRNLQQSDLGVYECIFTDLILGWKLRRIITLG